MTEHELQCQIAEWCRLNKSRIAALDYFYAIPNGGKRHITTAMSLKREGVKAGIPDIAIDYPTKTGFSGIKIELKTAKGRLSDKQKEWLIKFGRANFLAVVCRSLEEFINIVEENYKD